jgi:hypothetical protein
MAHTGAAFTFQAGARPIEQQTKYRNEPYAANGLPCLITVDPRVFHGSTYSKHRPAEPEVETAKPRRRMPTPRAKEVPLNSLAAPPPKEPRIDLELQTAPYLQEVVERPAVSELYTQTDAFLERPRTPPYIPAKTGVDIETQVEEDKLFDFDFEVRPIVAVIVGKTIEQAFMEVHEEEEFATIRRQKEAIEHRRNCDLGDILRLEETERRKFEEKQRRVAERLVYESEQQEVRSRVAARGFGEFFVSDLIGDALKILDARGYFYDEVERAIEINFMPWLGQAMGNPEEVRRLSNAIVKRVNDATVAYDDKLRTEIEQQIDVTEQKVQTDKNVVLRQMFVEDLASLKIRAARAAAKPQKDHGEEEDESHADE